jgi:hypothetical protein
MKETIGKIEQLSNISDPSIHPLYVSNESTQLAGAMYRIAKLESEVNALKIALLTFRGKMKQAAEILS